MTRRRNPAPPPALIGYEFIEPIGSGGFADVYLYEQQHPKRRVAVKVLHTDRISDSALAEFTAEANAMALLSAHPSIVTIHDAGTASDGRPYLVMEYAPGANLQMRYRQRPLTVPETLRVGVQIASAVETVHRAGILHRDIKPANILTTAYNNPALTDFGIASTSAVETASGLSIPWSAPELFAEKPYGGPEADVYALAATLYTFLAGRSPFELKGGGSSVELIDRIERMPVPPLQRPDVPPSLERVLARAMAKSPNDRYESAISFARQLQTIQREMSLAVTPIDIIHEELVDVDESEENDNLTRVRSVTSIAPGEAPTPDIEPETLGQLIDSRPLAMQVADPHRAAVDVEPRRRQPAAPAHPERFWASRRRRGWTIGIGLTAIAAVAVSTFIVSGVPSQTPAQRATAEPQNITLNRVPAPMELHGEVVDGVAVFTWSNPDPKSGDEYFWKYTGVGVDDRTHTVTDVRASVRLLDGPQTCISVAIRRADGPFSTNPAEACISPQR